MIRNAFLIDHYDGKPECSKNAIKMAEIEVRRCDEKLIFLTSLDT